MGINDTAEKINKWAESKGWNNDLNESPDSIGKQLTNMHSELSEAWEEIKNRRGIREVYFSTGVKPEGFGVELADCMIRIMHTAAFYNIDLESMIALKMEYNQKRPYRHGDKSA